MARKDVKSKRAVDNAVRVLGVEFPGREQPRLSRVGQERRGRILDAAVKLFREHGFHGASIDAIGDEAGVSGPALYYYFKDKTEVLLAVFLRVGDRMMSRLTASISGLTDPTEVLDAIIDSHVEAMWENRVTFPLLYQENRYLTPEEYEESLQRRKFWYDLWAHCLHESRPELTLEEASTMAQGALWLIQSVAFYEVNRDEELTKATLKRMARTALFATPATAEVEP